jgi:hypothetical protein
VRAFQLIFQDIGCHVILESFQRIFLWIDSFLVNWQYLWSMLIIARIISYDPDIGLLTGYVLYQLPVELEFMDLNTFPR